MDGLRLDWIATRVGSNRVVVVVVVVVCSGGGNSVVRSSIG